MDAHGALILSLGFAALASVLLLRKRLREIEVRKRLEAQLMQAERRSVAGGLISGVAHELNNPLSAVIGFAELVQESPVSPNIREDLRLLYESAVRCKNIVQGLLQFVREEAPAMRRVPLNRVAEAAIALYEYRLVKVEDIALEIELEPSSPAIAGEFQKVQQAAVNLLNNAVDALKDWPGRRVIRVRTRAAGGRCILEVEDTGPGIAEALREKVFEPFYTTKPAGKGTGLGLSICRQIVLELGGELRCEAGAELGARFVASFPACPDEIVDAPSPAHLPAPVAGARVLIVDDEPELVRWMAKLLRDDGLDVVPAANFADADRRVREEKLDLVIADVAMGPDKGTGLRDVSRGLKSPPRFLFVTGDVLNRPMTDLLTEWGTPYLTKPFLRTEFLRSVRKALRD